MVDATILSAARMGWQLLAIAPCLTRWLLRRAFPISECSMRFLVDMPGNYARFELLSIRPSPALVGLEARVYNSLPFAVEFSAFKLIGTIDSTGFLDVVLNSKHLIPAAGFARIPLHEIGLSDHRASWVRQLRRECARVQVTLHWHCASAIHDWEGQGTYECNAYINVDKAEQHA